VYKWKFHNMKFETFWTRIIKLTTTSNRFLTIRRKKIFRAKYSGGLIVVTPTSSEYDRNVVKKQFFDVWNRAKKLPKHEQFKRVNYNDLNRNGTYILAMIKYVLGEGDIE